MAQEDLVLGEAGQETHGYSNRGYIAPRDPLLLERLEWFQDQKLALMIHFGTYSQLGIIESWALSDEDASWSRAQVDWETDPEAFKKQYWALNKTFNPIRFSPDVWAQTAQECGFKYLVFTTKHHDGFCMYDSAYTDYKLTGPDCPFHTHRYADLCRSLFDAFRARGLGIAAYFSKADWHVPSYWWPKGPRHPFTARGPSYDPADNPVLWEEFIQYTHSQVMELVENYGRLDVLWFDGGWVNARDGQDIRLGELVDRARQVQPWLLSADRTVGGPYENYITPEQTVPDRPLGVPWESNITLGRGFSYTYDDEYKPLRQVIHLLIDVVAKGGNLALNVGPQPDGRLPEGALSRLRGLGTWMKEYGEAIYGTRPVAPYRSGDFAFTRKGNAVYALYLRPQDGGAARGLIPWPGPVTQVLDVRTGAGVAFTPEEGGLRVPLPPEDEAPIAHAFKLI